VSSDPYKYFRIEARELVNLLGQGVLALEKGPPGDVVPRLLRAAHTLKGAARVVKQGRIAENAHAIEDILAPIRSSENAVGREDVEKLLGLVDEISGLVASLGGPVAEKAAAKVGVPEEPLGIARTDTAEMDALLDGVLETAVRLRAVRGALGTLAEMRRLTDVLAGQKGDASANRDATRAGVSSVAAKTRELGLELRGLVTAMDRSLSEGLDQAERELDQVRDTAERLRLVPASTLFPQLERTVRDVAHSLGKDASFRGNGGDVRVDAHVLAELQGALVQIMRNAVAHGIETTAERTRAQKPRTGTVEVTIERRANRVACVCRDDGRGIDAGSVRSAAERAGLMPKDATPLAAEALLPLLMKGGFSTTGAVTEMSGRGIGLDIVRETAARLGGAVTLRTEPGRGTTLELTVPVSLSALDALLVEAAGNTAAIPLESVQRTLRLGPGDVVRTAEGETIVHEGRVVPFARLAPSGQASVEVRRAGFTAAVVIQARGSLAAISVDRLVGTANVVVRSLPPLALADPLVAGVSLDGKGMPRLVLDPEGLVTMATARRGTTPEAVAPRPARILVIDDSLTTRMLEQSILESAGYEVALASSAEEGLEKAGAERYALFLVDVEMPGMDGFAFVERTRADPKFCDTPAILVSSRNAPEDLERGRQAGARAYVVKGDFDQAGLLAIIRGLVSS
jgi:two-component system chemotaxis sensor kinase CheA